MNRRYFGFIIMGMLLLMLGLLGLFLYSRTGFATQKIGSYVSFTAAIILEGYTIRCLSRKKK